MYKYARFFCAVKVLLAVALAITFSGCTVTRPFTVPETLANQGLLVGQIATDDYYAVLDSALVINGQGYGASMEQGHILLALEPGQYTLEKFTNSIGNTYYTYPYQRTFTIEAGKVTNLGLMLFQPKDLNTARGESNRYTVFLADNTREMKTFLQEIRPALYASLRQKDPVLAPGNYMNATQLHTLRYNLAVRKLKTREWPHQAANKNYVTTAAGTVAKFKRNSSGVANGLEIIETNTLADLNACHTMATIACLISSSEFILIKDNKVTHQVLPAGVAGNSLVALGATVLTLVDDSMNIYTTINGGKNWSKYDKAAFPQPLDTLYREGDHKHRFEFFMAPNGYFIYPTGVKPGQNRLVYADYLNTSFRDLNVPDSAENIARLQETNAGVYFWPNPPGLTSAKIYVLPKGKTSWETRDLPQFLCQQIGFPDNSGTRLQLSCNVPFGSEKIWESKDGGVTWAEIPKTSSMFKS